MHFIELNKIDDNKNINEMTGIEQWVTFIKDSDNEKRKELIDELVKRKEAIKMAAEVLSNITEDELMREKIIAIEKARQDQLTRECCARENGIREGIEIGKIKGREEGREEGIQFGEEKGKTASKLQIAKKLLSKGMSNSEVKEITGLSDEEIEGMT